MRELIQAEQALGDYTRKHARHIIAGELGNNSGTVDHPTRTNFVYVKLHGDDNQVVEAEAVASFPHQAGIVVAVELVKRNAASRYQVLGIASNILFVGSPWAGTLGEHAAQHQRRDLGQGGFDPLDIYNRALVNLRGRAQATPDLTVYVERGFYFIGGALYEWTGGNSAAFTVPAGSFGVTVRRCDLLYIGSDQALHIVQGATTSDGSVPAYPTTPYPCIPIAYVYLTSSSTNIQESNIKDARVILTASDGTPVAHNLLSSTHGDTLVASVAAGDLIIGNDTPKWSRLAITVPAANVRNVVGVDNGETKPSWKVALDGTTPADIAGAAAAGTSLVFSHRDHVHRGVLSINKAADTTLYGAVTLSEGANITLTQVGQDISIAAAAGGGAHTILSATHTDTLADTVVDGDVIIGNATPKWSRLAISAPAANVRNVLGVDNTETRPSWKTALDSTNPANAVLTASPGTSLVFSHRDHVHAIDQTIAPTWTGLHKFQKSNIQTTYTDAVQLINNTAATAGVTVQQSPSEHFTAHTWKTTLGDLTYDMQIALVPTSGANPTAVLHWQLEDSQGLTWNDIMTLGDQGDLFVARSVTAPYKIIAQSGTYDGIDLGAVAYGSSSYRVSLQVSPLTGNHVVDFGDYTGTAALGAGTATVSSTNSVASANHTHAITSSSNPGAAAAILATDASGNITIQTLTTQNIEAVKSYYAGTYFAGWISYRSNGSIASPTATASGDELMTLNARGYQATTGAYTNNLGRVLMLATENFTSTAQGTKVQIVGVANGSTAQAVVATFQQGVQVGAPTGGDKGSGTANFAGDIYKNNVAYTSPAYALEHWAEGSIITHADKPGAQDYRRLTLGEVEDYVRRHYELPGHRDSFGLFDGGDWMLEKVEEVFTYLIEMDKRVAKLEAR